jgi:hypothetical protein
MNNSNYPEYLKLFTNMMQEIANSTPLSWGGEMITLHRRGRKIECQVVNQDNSERLEISEKISSLCNEIVRLKPSEDWSIDWSKATVSYILGDEPGDFSTTAGNYEYTETNANDNDNSVI